MRDIYRDINLPVDDSTLPDLEGLTKEDIVEAFRLVTSQASITRTINRLHNRRKERQSKEIKAWQLVSSGFEAMAEIQIMIDNFDIISGRITNARAVANGDTIVITILGGNHIETTWSVHRDAVVRVWRKELRYIRPTAPAPDYDKPADHGFLRASYIAENLSTFFGKRMSVKNVGTGVLDRIVVSARDQDYFLFDLGIVRNVKVHKNALVQVYKTLEPEQYDNAKASAILATPSHYLGRRVVFDNDRIDGVLQEVVRKVDTAGVILKVNGDMTQLAWNENVKVYPRQEPGIMRPGRYPWGSSDARVPGRNPFVETMEQAYGRFLGEMLFPVDQPDYQGDSWWFFNNNTFEGKTVQLGSGDPAKSGVKGVCTQVTYENGKLVFVIDGRIYKRNRHTTLKVWNKKENN